MAPQFSRFALAAVVSLCGWILASPAGAQTNVEQPDETLPGFRSQQVYDVGRVDSVNLFSGEVHVTVPLGPEYPLSSGLTWRLAAHYSSKLWHMFQYDSGVQSSDCPGADIFVARAHVGGFSTIGAGWTLELGSYRPHPPLPGDPIDFYKSPDGAHHTFANLDADSDLRLDPQADGTVIVRKSDGTVLNFTHLYEIPAPANGFDFSDEDRDPVVPRQTLRYGLDSIVDRFGNKVLQVTYAANCVSKPCPADAWKVLSVQLSNPALNPARTITFNWGKYNSPSGSFDVLNSIQFPVSGGGRLTAGFAFKTDGTVYRSFFDSAPPPPKGRDVPRGPSQTNLPFLASITQASQTYSFDYDMTTNSGVLKTLTLPTGGRIVYGYSSSTALAPRSCGDCPGCQACVPERDAGAPCTLASAAPNGPATVQATRDFCTLAGLKQQFIDASPAVISRTELDLPGGAPDSTTTFERDQFGSADPAHAPSSVPVSPDRIVRRVIVKRPDGNGNTLATKHIFSATPFGSSGSEVSRRSYANCDTGGTPVRSFVQCFPASGRQPDRVCGVMENQSQITSFDGVNSLRPDQQVTWYGANPLVSNVDTCMTSVSPPACWQDAFSNFDTNASEYSVVKRSSNSGILVYPQNATRTTTTVWAPVSVPGGTWLPKLYSSKTVMDTPCLNPPCTVTTSYSFDTSNGFLNWSSVSDSTYGTMTHSWTRDTGAPDAFGRENANTETLSASFDSTNFVNTRTFRSGLTVTTQRTGIGWKSFDADRDASTGLVTSSRDPNGLVTAYGYDALARLTSVVPPGGELATTTCYLDTGATGEMSAVFAKKGGAACSPDDGVPQAGSGPLEAYQYDGMGRLKRQMRRLPTPLASGSYFALREIRYNSAGLKVFESEWTPCGTSPSATSARSCFPVFASKGTSYSNFDFLGRPKTIQLADGNIVTKSFDDPSGLVPNSDFTEMTTMTVSGALVTGGIRKDIFGRSLMVAEPGPPPFGPVSAYRYNALDKVASVDVLNAGQQTRTFTYDALGLLRSETHPEKGTTSYAAYNALGEVKAKSEGGNSYAYSYDAVGRVTATSANGLPYLSNLYDTDIFGGTGGYVLGRLVQQNAYHPLSDQNIRVAHNYAYGGLGGRLSVDDSYALLGSTVLFHAPATFTWNPLGLLDTHGHARSTGSFSQATTYVSGLPYAITADGKPFVAKSEYNPSAGLLSYQTANGVTTLIDADPNLMARPAQVRTTGADVNFASGIYTYDGVGNITSIGGDIFGYNPRSQLAYGYYAWPGSPWDSYSYDAFGNQTGHAWEAGYQPLDTNSSTNRLVSSSYDLLGNLTINGTDRHAYDALSRQTRYVAPGANERYYYDGAGERLARVVFSSSLPQQSVQESFYNLTPCRILDTRNPVGTYGGPSITGQGSRSFPVTGICGIPSNAKSLALNVTTVNATAASGNVRLYPSGLSYQPLGTANAYKAGYARANQTFGSIDGPTSGSFTLFNDAPAGYPVDVIVDVTGYFAPGPSAPPQAGDSWFVTVRDLDKRPSTEFRYDTVPGTTTVLKDYVYLGGQLVGTYTTTGLPNGTVFYTNDHLGSPRFLTAGASPTKLAEYKYRAFGLALSGTIPGQGPEFASMERDLASSDLYDHARYVGGKLGRFKSADQLGGHVEDPQSWNRYAYARNNPVANVDRDGKETGSITHNCVPLSACGGSAPLKQEAALWIGIAGAGVAALEAPTVLGGGLVSTFLGTHPTLAGWLGAAGLGMVGAPVPAPQAILQGVTNAVSGDLAANPALARTVLSQAQYAAGQGTAGVARMQYGNAMEELVAQQVQASPALSQMFRHVGGPNRPDFVGRIGSEAVGMTFDVTTKTAAAAHQARPYGLGLQLITYERSETFRLFP